jgi:hypothetical protein
MRRWDLEDWLRKLEHLDTTSRVFVEAIAHSLYMLLNPLPESAPVDAIVILG